MSVTVRFECDGCEATANGEERIRKKFRSFSGRDYGIGVARIENTPEDVCPNGWVAFDPYTYCTYCPRCWAGIMGPGDEEISA